MPPETAGFPAPPVEVDNDGPKVRVPRATVVAIAVFPLMFGTVDLLQDVTFGQPSGVRLAPRMIPGVAAFYAVLATLTPVVHRVVRKAFTVPISRARIIGSHLVAAPIFAFTHLGLTMILQRALIPHEPNAAVHLANLTRMFVMSSLMWYLVSAVTFHAVLYYLRSRQNEIEAARLAAGLAEARLSALSAQLGSHFVFNTLNTIKCLAESGETAAVVEVSHDLSDLLREVRRRDAGPTHAVREEIALLEKYLRILQVRFGSRLRSEIRVDARAREARVPVMVLQLLTENAVKHGYAASTGGIEIEVEVRRLDRSVLLRVDDSGPGFGTGGGRGGVGLSNLRARLETLYGEDFQLTFGESPLGGAGVVVKLPFRRTAPAFPRPNVYRARTG